MRHSGLLTTGGAPVCGRLRSGISRAQLAGRRHGSARLCRRRIDTSLRDDGPDAPSLVTGWRALVANRGDTFRPPPNRAAVHAVARAGDPPQHWGEAGPACVGRAGRVPRPNPSANSVGGSWRTGDTRLDDGYPHVLSSFPSLGPASGGRTHRRRRGGADAPAPPCAHGRAALALPPLPALAGTVAPAPAYAHASGSAAQAAVNTALAQLGDRYAWAGAGPNSFDCSGLTQFAYQAAGISLPHSSRAQSTMGAPVSQGALQPGDLVFFYSPVSHVGIYIGNGQVVHAPSAGDVVKITDLAHMPGFATARRLA